jgi:hypothetical protein
LNFINPLLPVHGNDRGQLLALMQARGNAPANRLSADVLPPMLPDRIAELAQLSMETISDRIPAFSGNLVDGLDITLSIITTEIAVARAELTDPALTDAEIEALQEQIAALEELRQNLTEARNHAEQDPNRFMQRIVSEGGTSVSIDLLREINRDFEASTHNHRAHMWSIQHAMMPQVQMNLDRILNSIVTMINDAVTGNLRGEDGNFLFYQTDADGNPYIPDPTDIDPVTNEPRRVPLPPYDANMNAGVPVFVRATDIEDFNRHTAMVNAGVTPPPPPWEWPWPVFGEENPNRATTIFTATNVRMNPELLVAGGHNLLGLSLSGAPGDTDLLVALQGVWMSTTSHYAVNIDGRNFNVQDAYIRFTGNIASEINEANNKVSTQTVTTDQAQNMRMAVKGVSMDEELNAMLRFQFAFQAASRVFNMIDGMIDRIVNGTGRVGL